MNKREFMDDLKKFLQRLPAEEQADILADYEEHFRAGAAEGTTEEQTAAGLGSPMEIARGYYTQRAQQEEETVYEAPRGESSLLRSVLLLLALAVFNIVLVLGPWFAVGGAILGILGAGAGTTFAGGAAISSSLAAIIQGAAASSAISGLFMGVGLGALGLLLMMLGVWLGRWFITLTARYLRWNLDIIQK